MNVEEASSVIEAYSSFIKKNMFATQQGNSVCITTPMLNRNNDCMNVYIGDGLDGSMIVTDLGETMNDLELSGLSMTHQHLEIIENILTGFSVEQKDGELFVRTSRDNLAARMNMLLQAMASVDDMYLLSQGGVRSLFVEDIENWMVDRGISVVSAPSFNGRSELPYKFDFAIGRTKRKPMRLIKAVNNPSRPGVQNALFGWEDVKTQRADCEGYVFLNAANTKSGNVSGDVIEACKVYGLQPVIWGVDEESYLDALAA